MAKPQRSIVEYYSKKDGNSCGYCKSSSSSCSHGMWAHSLSVEEYQSLIDRGWRRSGHYCYKPVMDETCCPSYTIKCDAIQFKLTRSQRKLLKKFNHYLITGEQMKGCPKHQDRNETTDILSRTTQSCVPKHDLGTIEEDRNESPTTSDLTETTETVRFAPETSTPSSQQLTGTQVKTSPITIVPPKSSESSKAKHLRIERRKQTLLSRGLTLKEVTATMQASKLRRMTKEKTLGDFMNLPENAKHRLEIKLVRVQTKAFDRTAQQEGTLFAKYQTTIHRETEEDTDFNSFKGFLIDSPLIPLEISDFHQPISEGPGYGSFHQQYWLDGRLIAVGVLDILPRCVSSVYFFYDPDYSWLSLGTVSSLREVEFTRSLQAFAPDLGSYYMGFYIHSCPKMRYKGNLRPSYLLCPETYTWHDIHTARQLLNQNKYSRLSPNSEAKDENGTVDLNQIPILTAGKVMPYRRFKQMYDHDEEHPMIQEYAQLVGQFCALRMFLVQ